MAVYVLSPAFEFQFFDDNGDPLALGKVNSYITGTSTPTFTFSDSIGTQNTNPIILSASGRCRIYLDPTITYKFIVTDAADVPVGLTMDPVNPLPTTIATTTFSASAGSAGSPSYTFTGDTNAGIFKPSTDTIAITTAGTERMRVTSTGGVNVGGTTDPGNHNLLVTGTVQAEGQPEFLAYNSADDAAYSVVGALNIDFDTEVYDTTTFAADVFTAPVSGRYLFVANIHAAAITVTQNLWLYLITSNRNYILAQANFNSGTANFETMNGSAIADMDIGDTASVQLKGAIAATITISGGTAGFGGGTGMATFFSGRLVP